MTNVEYLRSQGQRCRTLADSISDEWTREVLLKLAVEYDEKAAAQDEGDDAAE